MADPDAIKEVRACVWQRQRPVRGTCMRAVPKHALPQLCAQIIFTHNFAKSPTYSSLHPFIGAKSMVRSPSSSPSPTSPPSSMSVQHQPHLHFVCGIRWHPTAKCGPSSAKRSPPDSPLTSSRTWSQCLPQRRSSWWTSACVRRLPAAHVCGGPGLQCGHCLTHCTRAALRPATGRFAAVADSGAVISFHNEAILLTMDIICTASSCHLDIICTHARVACSEVPLAYSHAQLRCALVGGAVTPFWFHELEGAPRGAPALLGAAARDR